MDLGRKVLLLNPLSPCSPGFYHSAAVPSVELILAKEPLLRLPLGLLIERIHDY